MKGTRHGREKQLKEAKRSLNRLEGAVRREYVYPNKNSTWQKYLV